MAADDDTKTDDMKHSFYLRLMRASIGGALREQFTVTDPLPERLEKLLKNLDKPSEPAPIRQPTDNA